MLKALFWLGSSRRDIRDFPVDARRRAYIRDRSIGCFSLPSSRKGYMCSTRSRRKLGRHLSRPGRCSIATARTVEQAPRCDKELGIKMVMKIERSSGNVFRDLGFETKEAESLRLRAELMAELKRLIQARKLKQNSAAKLFGVTQPRISDLVRGKIDLFSIETLVD